MIRMPPIALTQTLKARFFKHRAKVQLAKVLPLVEKLLKQICTKYELVAELTATTNIHFHGTVWFMNESGEDVYRDSVRHLGFCLLKKIDNMEVWDQYIHKDTTRTLTTLNKDDVNQTYKMRHIVRHHKACFDFGLFLSECVKIKNRNYNNNDIENLDVPT